MINSRVAFSFFHFYRHSVYRNCNFENQFHANANDRHISLRAGWMAAGYVACFVFITFSIIFFAKEIDFIFATTMRTNRFSPCVKHKFVFGYSSIVSERNCRNCDTKKWMTTFSLASVIRMVVYTAEGKGDQTVARWVHCTCLCFTIHMQCHTDERRDDTAHLRISTELVHTPSHIQTQNYT